MQFKQEERLNLIIKPISQKCQIRFEDISSYETITQLKDKIQDALGLPSNLLNLHLKSQLLPDSSSLDQCLINSTSKLLYLSYKLKGGSQIFVVLPNQKRITVDCQGNSKIQTVIERVLQRESQTLQNSPAQKLVLLKKDQQGRFIELDPKQTLKQSNVKSQQELTIKIRSKRRQLYLVHQNGKTITIPYDENMRISDLKQVQSDIHLRSVNANQESSTKLENQKTLIYKGKQLQDRSTLANEGIEPSQSILLRNKMINLFLKLKIKQWSETMILDLRVLRNDRIEDLKAKIIKKLRKKENISVRQRDIKIKQVLKQKDNLDDLVNRDAKQAYFEVAIDKYREVQLDELLNQQKEDQAQKQEENQELKDLNKVELLVNSQENEGVKDESNENLQEEIGINQQEGNQEESN